LSFAAQTSHPEVAGAVCFSGSCCQTSHLDYTDWSV
jgi:hypothetical protein